MQAVRTREGGVPVDGNAAACCAEDWTSVLHRRKIWRRGGVAMERIQALKAPDILSGTPAPTRRDRIG
jgi:hypothetical protein